MSEKPHTSGYETSVTTGPNLHLKRAFVEDEGLGLPDKKRAKHKKSKRVDNVDIDFVHQVHLAIGRLDSHLLADYIAQRTKHHMPDWSLIELENQRVPGIRHLSVPHHSKNFPTD